MGFYEVLDQVVQLLQQRGWVTYRALKHEFQLDDAFLEDLKDELIKALRVKATWRDRGQAHMLPPHFVYFDSPNHHHLDNCTFARPDRRTVYITEALSGDILMARMPVASKPLYGLE